MGLSYWLVNSLGIPSSYLYVTRSLLIADKIRDNGRHLVDSSSHGILASELQSPVRRQAESVPSLGYLGNSILHVRTC